MRKHTSEDLSLLLTYLSVVGIWFAIPSVSLLLKRDERYPIVISILAFVVFLLIVAYVAQWEFLFPPSAALHEKYLADYDKVKWCKCHGLN